MHRVNEQHAGEYPAIYTQAGYKAGRPRSQLEDTLFLCSRSGGGYRGYIAEVGKYCGQGDCQVVRDIWAYGPDENDHC
jgi:hypothetical protein